MPDNEDPVATLQRVRRMEALLAQPSQAQPPDTFDPNARLAELMQQFPPRTAAQQAYTGALGQMPQRTEPSGLRKIAGAMAGLGAGVSPVGIAGGQVVGMRYNPQAQMQAQEQVANAPYHQQMQDWQMRTGMLERGAREEDLSNRNQRMMIEQQIERERKAAADKQKQWYDEQRTKNAADRTEAYKRRIEVYEHIAKGGTLQTDRNGDVYMVYKDGTNKYVDISKFTPEEIIDLKRDAANSAIAARGAQTRQNIEARTGGQEEAAVTKGIQSRLTKAAPKAAAETAHARSWRNLEESCGRFKEATLQHDFG